MGVHWGLANAQPHLHGINIRKIYQNLMFSYRLCHYFILLWRAKDCRGRSRNTVFIHTTYHGNGLPVVENTLWALELCILFLGKKWLSWNANLPYSWPSHCGIINNAVSCCPEVRSLERKKENTDPMAALVSRELLSEAGCKAMCNWSGEGTAGHCRRARCTGVLWLTRSRGHPAPPNWGQKQTFSGYVEHGRATQQRASPGSEQVARGVRSTALEVSLSRSAVPTARKSVFLVSSS